MFTSIRACAIDKISCRSMYISNITTENKHSRSFIQRIHDPAQAGTTVNCRIGPGITTACIDKP